MGNPMPGGAIISYPEARIIHDVGVALSLNPTGLSFRRPVKLARVVFSARVGPRNRLRCSLGGECTWFHIYRTSTLCMWSHFASPARHPATYYQCIGRNFPLGNDYFAPFSCFGPAANALASEFLMNNASEGVAQTLLRLPKITRAHWFVRPRKFKSGL
jgi:hypothetical protein